MHTPQLTASELIAFEQGIAESFNAGLIRYPIHLSGNNESQLIEIFKDFKKGDYCYSSWRSHYHALLAGIPPEEVKRQIMAGRSMTICSPEHRFFASAIVAGCCPIAVGTAWAIKRRGGSERVWIFCGDMTSQTGTALECYNYAKYHELPLVWVVEDNNKSVCSDTRKTLGGFQKLDWDYYYQWENPYPHAGSGRRIQF